MCVTGGDDPADILDAMKTRTFGVTDLRCSEIGFGTWALGSTWWGKITSGEGENLLRRALGPAIGWREEGLKAIETRRLASLQTVYNVLEQEPGRDFLAAAEEHGIGIMARVPTSSGLLEDKYTLETTFPEHDHRSHRPRE